MLPQRSLKFASNRSLKSLYFSSFKYVFVSKSLMILSNNSSYIFTSFADNDLNEKRDGAFKPRLLKNVFFLADIFLISLWSLPKRVRASDNNLFAFACFARNTLYFFAFARFPNFIFLSFLRSNVPYKYGTSPCDLFNC